MGGIPACEFHAQFDAVVGISYLPRQDLITQFKQAMIIFSGNPDRLRRYIRGRSQRGLPLLARSSCSGSKIPGPSQVTQAFLESQDPESYNRPQRGENNSAPMHPEP